jgi:hypothetical protein
MKAPYRAFASAAAYSLLMACADGTSNPPKRTTQSPTGQDSRFNPVYQPGGSYGGYGNTGGTNTPLEYTQVSQNCQQGQENCPNPNGVAVNNQIAQAAGNIFSTVIGGIFGNGSGNSQTTTQTTGQTTTTGGSKLPPQNAGSEDSSVPSTSYSDEYITTGSDACNDSSNRAFPGYSSYGIVRKDGYFTIEVKSIGSYGTVVTGSPEARFSAGPSPAYGAIFQSGYIFRGSLVYNVRFDLVLSGGVLTAVVKKSDGSLVQVGSVDGYSQGTTLPRIVTVRFGSGACLVQYGSGSSYISGGAGYLLVP